MNGEREYKTFKLSCLSCGRSQDTRREVGVDAIPPNAVEIKSVECPDCGGDHWNESNCYFDKDGNGLDMFGDGLGKERAFTVEIDINLPLVKQSVAAITSSATSMGMDVPLQLATALQNGKISQLIGGGKAVCTFVDALNDALEAASDAGLIPEEDGADLISTVHVTTTRLLGFAHYLDALIKEIEGETP